MGRTPKKLEADALSKNISGVIPADLWRRIWDEIEFNKARMAGPRNFNEYMVYALRDRLERDVAERAALERSMTRDGKKRAAYTGDDPLFRD